MVSERPTIQAVAARLYVLILIVVEYGLGVFQNIIFKFIHFL